MYQDLKIKKIPF